MLRTLHRVLSPWLFVLVAVSAVTGVVFRAGKTWFGLPGGDGQTVMEIHTGEWLSPELSPYYVLAAGGGLLFLLITGGCLLLQRSRKGGTRRWHRILGWTFLLPLAAFAITGILYKLGQDWFGFSEDTSRLLMTIHEGRWLGKQGSAIYVTVCGLGLLGLGLLGLPLLRVWRRVFTKRAT